MFPPRLPSFAQPFPLPHRFHLAHLGCHLSTSHHRAKVHHDFSLPVFIPAGFPTCFFGSVSLPPLSIPWRGGHIPWVAHLTLWFRVHMLSHFSLCNPMDSRPPDSSVHGISRQGLEWVAMPSSRGSSPPRDQTCVS